VKGLALVIAVLSYNVHGLNHWLVSDDPEARMPEISSRLERYDVALMQESWDYFDLLASHLTHPVRERGGGPQAGMFGQSGLVTFARPRLVALNRESLGACSGWLGGANDCWADKGFLRLRLRLANGVEADFYTLHLDAGRGDDDRAARALQLDHLARRVQSLSGDGPLVVAGDFNSDASNDADRGLLDRFRESLRLADTGARRADDGRFADERIDYIFYRAGGGVAIEPVAVGEAREFELRHAPLSDHPALFARLRFAASDPN
jgi:endonuclease/exonuclease/phosphatase family metal-dependent hydrolase